MRCLQNTWVVVLWLVMMSITSCVNCVHTRLCL